MKSKDLRALLVENGYQLVRHKYDWKFLATKIGKYYEEISTKKVN